MRKWVLVTMVLAGCSRNPPPAASLTGAAAPRDAAVAFLMAANAQDLQAMSTVWGTEKGPARDQLDRAELDRRLVILQPCYEHQRYQILDESAGPDGQRIVRVQITRGNRTKTAAFKLVRGPSSRWYVLDADYATMRDFCAR